MNFAIDGLRAAALDDGCWRMKRSLRSREFWRKVISG
jgi:hypothetical protein